MLQINKYFLNLLKKRQNNVKRKIWKKKKIEIRKLKKKTYLLNLRLNKKSFLYLLLVKSNFFYINLLLQNLNFNLAFHPLAKFTSRVHLTFNIGFFFKHHFNFIATQVFFTRIEDYQLLKKNWKSSEIFTKKNKKKNSLSYLKLNILSNFKNYRNRTIQNYFSSYSLLQRIYTSQKVFSYLLSLYSFKSKNYIYQNFFSNFKFFFRFLALPKFIGSLNALSHAKKNLYFKNKVYFIDHNKSPLKSMRLAREAYSIFSTRNTLRNVAYKRYVDKEVNKLSRIKDFSTQLSHIIRSYRFALTWEHVELIIKYGYIYLNGIRVYKNCYLQYNDLISLPAVSGLYRLNYFFYKKSLRVKKKLKKRNYILFLYATKFWMKRKKNLMHLNKWHFFYSLSVNKYFIFDYFTFTGIFLSKDIKFKDNQTLALRTSSVLKLYKWKFRAT